MPLDTNVKDKLEAYIISGGYSGLVCSGPEWVEFHLLHICFEIFCPILKATRNTASTGNLSAVPLPLSASIRSLYFSYSSANTQFTSTSFTFRVLTDSAVCTRILGSRQSCERKWKSSQPLCGCKNIVSCLVGMNVDTYKMYDVFRGNISGHAERFSAFPVIEVIGHLSDWCGVLGLSKFHTIYDSQSWE